MMYNCTMSAIIQNKCLRDRQRDLRDAAILDAAWDLLGKKGYEDWTLADLADKVGISRRTLYHHFSSKEAIAAATLARNNLMLVEEMQTIAPDANPTDRLKAIIRWILAGRVKRRLGPIGVIKANLGLIAKIKDFPIYQSANNVIQNRFTDLIRQVQDQGMIASRFPPDYLAALLFDMLKGIDVARWQEKRPQLIDDLIIILFNGMADLRHR